MTAGFDIHPLIAASLLLLLLIAVQGDLRARQIPNALSLGGLVLGLILNFVLRGTDGGSNALLGALAGGVILLPLWILRGLGGGDVKLMSAVGAHLGLAPAAEAAVFTLLCGGVAALVLLLTRRRTDPHRARSDAVAGQSFPYAPAIAAGSVLAVVVPLARAALVP